MATSDDGVDPLLQPIAPFIYGGWHAPFLGVGRPAREQAVFEAEEQAWCYNLWRCLDGAVELRRGAERWTLRPGQVGLCEPGMGAALSAGGRAYRVSFDILWRRRQLKEGRSATYRPIERVPQPPWHAIFGAPLVVMPAAQRMPAAADLVDEIATAYSAPRTRRLLRLALNVRLHEWIVDHAIAGDRGAGDDGTEVGAADADGEASFAYCVDRLFELHLREGAHLDDIARRLKVARRTLFVRYRAERGMTPSDGRDIIRLRRVENDLARGLPIARIARRCGFASATTFGAWFRAKRGTTASQWRSGRLTAHQRRELGQMLPLDTPRPE